MSLKIFQVGGSVRDELLGLKHHDIDYAVEADSFQHMKKFLIDEGYTIFVEKPEYGTIKARRSDKKLVADFTLCRKDGFYSDKRRPDSIKPSNLLDDLERRDFTINAIAKDTEENYIDPHGGIADIENRLLRCVGNTSDRLTEDPLRAIRALRFSITHSLQIDDEIWTLINSDDFPELLNSSVSSERIQEELNKMFKKNNFKSFKLFTKLSDKLLNTILSKVKFYPTLKNK